MKSSFWLIACAASVSVACQSSRAPVSTPLDADKSASSAQEVAAIVPELAASALAPARPVAEGRRPRLILTSDRVERARLNALAGSKIFKKIEADCVVAGETPQNAGYEGWDWGHLVARCSLAWHTTGKPAYAATAIRYLRALLDDRVIPGDGKGGEGVVRHDHGYPIRTHAFYSALGYDWLHDAPGMTQEFRAQIVDRLEAWLDWYKSSGYQRDAPVSNYFTGYFLALAYAGLAISGDDPRGDQFLERAESLFDDMIAPRYKKLLAGGDWPEGWQYGDGAATAMAFFIDGQRTARGRERLAEMPWLRDVVRHHAHAILPDGVTAYANGDWTSRPTHMPSRALDAIAMILPESDSIAAEARHLARKLRSDQDDWDWLRLLSDDPRAKAIDPRRGTRSYLASGTGLVLARSDWGADATFVSLQCGPSVEEADHQHADQGHFELVRGADALLLAVADYGAFATINHNTLLVDDGGASLDYSPNQGAWGRDSKIARYVDTDHYVYAEGDLTDAYRPAKLEYGAKRSVLQAQRALTFLRPGTVVIYDRVRLAEPTFAVAWAAHSLSAPVIDGRSFTVRKGKSVAEVKSLLPRGVKLRAVAEPQADPKARSAYQVNETWAPAFRIEMSAPRGREIRFLTVLQTGSIGFTARPAEAIDGVDIDGAAIGDAENRVAVVFPRKGTELPPGGTKWRMRAPRQLIAIGLEPGRRYDVVARPIESECELELKPGSDLLADGGGTLLMNMESCRVR